MKIFQIQQDSTGPIVFLSKCKKLASLLLLPAVLIGLASSAGANQPKSFTGEAELDGSSIFNIQNNYSDPLSDPEDEPFPIEENESPWEFGAQLGASHGMRAYGDKDGKVRAIVRTGNSSANHSQFGYARVLWQGNYTRDNSDNPSFKLNQSWLDIFANGSPGPGNLYPRDGGYPSPPFAFMYYEVELCNLTKSICDPLFIHESKMAGIVDDKITPLKMVTLYTQDYTATGPPIALDRTTGSELSKPYSDPFGHTIADTEIFSGCINADGNIVCFKTETGLRFELPEIEREINLDFFDVEEGEDFSVTYRLVVHAGEDAAEQQANAILGDPLATEPGGFSFETTNSPIASNVHICDYTPDPTRFINHGDGTVTDMHTSLMWQRCPLGYSLDENGTATDLRDDLCVAGSTHDYDWQAALQSADSDGFATHSDWKLPNAKQIESLVELSCNTPTIDTEAFPDTPGTPFWTSTPAAEGNQAWSVNFATGDVSPTGKVEAQAVRLVRSSSKAPVVPTPGLVAGNTVIHEGDDSNTIMNFPVILTRPAATDVNLDFETLALTAVEFDDFVPTSGTLTIPAGQLSGNIAVTVIGDTIVESTKNLRLILSNPSANVYLAKASSLGTIVDDEPQISVIAAAPQQVEGDAGTQSVEFVISLDTPAVDTIFVDYATADDSAIAGDDYVASSGTATFNTGETTASVLVGIKGDTEHENDNTFILILSNAVGGVISHASTAVAMISDDDGPGSYQALNDTGVVDCANSTSFVSCPESGLPQQDGDLGRDVTDNDNSDGVAGFEFTKLDNAGAPIANQAAFYYFDFYAFSINSNYAIWPCVHDKTTDLTWEIKTDVPGDLRNSEWAYSWYNSTGINDGANAGLANGGVCVDGNNCDTEKYIAAVNASNLCGYSDWRLPRINELYTLAIFGSNSFVNNGLDKNYFPLNFDSFWSATSSAFSMDQVWSLEFQAYDTGMVETEKASLNHIRLVRGGQ